MSVCPIDSRLYGDTVTVYRKTPSGISRRVVPECYLIQHQKKSTIGADSSFLLIIPWDGIGLMPGDKIFRGIGPETAAWSDLVPEITPQVSIVGKTTVRYWEGQPSHVEATQ